MKSESKIQQEIFVWFSNEYPNYIIHSVPNGVQIPLSNRERGRILSQMANIGMVNGISDLIIHLPNGQCIMVEVKTPTGKQSDAQIKIEKKMKAMHSNYIVVRSLEEFKEKIKSMITLNSKINGAVEELPETDQKIIDLFKAGGDNSCSTISKKTGSSTHHVSLVIDNYLKKLRKHE